MLDNIILDCFAHEKKVGSLNMDLWGIRLKYKQLPIRVSGDLIAHLEL